MRVSPLFLSHTIPSLRIFTPQFMEDIDKEINAMKIAINSRGRTVASEFMKQFDS